MTATHGARGAHEALPQTPPGGKPPETPAPFPCDWIIGKRGDLSRVRKPRPKAGRALDTSPRFPTHHWDEGKGATACLGLCCLPLVGPALGAWERAETRADEQPQLTAQLTLYGLRQQGVFCLKDP